MRKLLAFCAIIFSLSAAAQSDSIYLHNGKIVSGTVSTVSEFTVSFNYDGETAVQTVGKYAVAKIVYGKSHRMEKISDKVVIASKDDWENVVILEDKSEVGGLTKVGDVKGKTSFLFNYHSTSGNDKKSEDRLKQSAAEMGCPFILLTADKGANLLSAQAIKKGIAYKY